MASNYTVANWGQLLGFATLMNIDRWHDLSREHQSVLRQAGSRAIDYFARLQIEEMDLVIDGLRTGEIGNKVDVYLLPESERAILNTAGEKYAQEWIEQADKDGVDGRAIWNEYKSLLAKYQQKKNSKGYPWQR